VKVPARPGRAIRLDAGAVAGVINTHGSQVVDVWALAGTGLEEHMSMAHTRVRLACMAPSVGDTLVTNHRRPILTLVEDTSPGDHDTLMAACDIHRYRQLGHLGYHDNCHDNFNNALREHGYGPRAVPDPLNLFMNVPWDSEGRLAYRPPLSRPGDCVRLRAELDLILVLSACPQDMIPVNGALQRPMDFALELPGEPE
jgi:uncharacterized protein YcgI (DUF1989 family)